MDYLQANRGDAKYLVATTNSMTASPIILNTDEPQPVITLGGFMGRDPVFTTEKLTNLINEGAVRFFLVPARERMEEMRAERESNNASSQGWGASQGAPQGPPRGGPPDARNESETWVQDNCEQVSREQWQSSDAEEQEEGGGPWMRRAQALYDCGPGRR